MLTLLLPSSLFTSKFHTCSKIPNPCSQSEIDFHCRSIFQRPHGMTTLEAVSQDGKSRNSRTNEASCYRECHKDHFCDGRVLALRLQVQMSKMSPASISCSLVAAFKARSSWIWKVCVRRERLLQVNLVSK